MQDMFNERFGELVAEARRQVPRRRRVGRRPQPHRRDVLARRARAGRQDARTASRRSRSKPSACASSGSRRRSSIARRSGCAVYERAYNERDKTESGSFAQEYLAISSTSEPAPGIAYEYQLVKQVLPGHHRLGNDRDGEAAARRRQPRRAGDLAAEAGRPRADRSRAAGRARRRRNARRSPPGATPPPTGALDGHKPQPAAVASRREIPDARRHHRALRERRRSLAEADRFQERSGALHLEAPGRRVAGARRPTISRRRWPTTYVERSGVGGIKALDLAKMLAGKLASASPFISLSTHGISGSAAPADLETALQLLSRGSSPRRATTPRRSR